MRLHAATPHHQCQTITNEATSSLKHSPRQNLMSKISVLYSTGWVAWAEITSQFSTFNLKTAVGSQKSAQSHEPPSTRRLSPNETSAPNSSHPPFSRQGGTSTINYVRRSSSQKVGSLSVANSSHAAKPNSPTTFSTTNRISLSP